MRHFAILAFVFSAFLTSCSKNAPKEQSKENPKYLYKIVTVEAWEESKNNPDQKIQLSDDDQKFIHLAKRDQLRGIISKYWMTVPVFYILQLDTEKLPGKLAYETNPGGETKYYHLYNGSIPLNAVVKVKKMTKKE